MPKIHEPATSDLELARALLFATKGATCIAVSGDDLLVSYEPGVRPLLGWLAEGRDLSTYAVADKVVGKAPALIYAILGPAAVFGSVMSVGGRAVLVANDIKVSCDTLVAQISNRDGTGQCPMDASVANIFDPHDAINIIEVTAKAMDLDTPSA